MIYATRIELEADCTDNPEDSKSEQEFGASSVFQVVKLPEAAEKPPASAAEYRAPAPLSPQQVLGNTTLEEPVVHKVVLGGSVDPMSSGILDRIRLASAEKAPDVEPAKGSGGFTQLLRTLEVDAPVAGARPLPVPPAQPTQESGFTSLLRTLGSEDKPAAPPADQVKIEQVRPTQPGPIAAAPAPAPGGFTELLQVVPAADPTFNRPAFAAEPPPVQSQPGSFTQLFSSLSAPEAPLPAAPAARRPAASSAGSFTQMLSIEPLAPAAPVEPPYYESKPATGSMNYGLTPETPSVSQSARSVIDPFAPAPLPEIQPAQSPQQGSVGITRLIRMLDEPSTLPAPRVEAAPTPPAAGGPGVWTQTFASLAAPNDAPVPTATEPDRAPPVSYSPPPAPGAAAGPSEFTRILDASRIREMAMRGEQVPVTENPASAPQPRNFAVPPPPQMPSYPVAPPPPPIAAMPPVYPPAQPQMPAYYPPHAGSLPAPGTGVPQPGMYAPAAPTPPAVQPPAAKPAPPASKLQQLVPVLLIAIVVLLVVILVTVIFLMKH